MELTDDVNTWVTIFCILIDPKYMRFIPNLLGLSTSVIAKYFVHYMF